MSEVLNPDLYYRISDLPPAADITGAEVVEAVQDGKNVKFTLAQLFVAGDSAYDVALENGFVGDEAAWLKSLVGKSAYEMAVKNGFKGTEADWLLTLVGQKGIDGTNGTDGIDGIDGKDAYQQAVDNGFEGTLDDWLKSLVGKSALEILAAEYPQVTDAASLAAFLKGLKGDRGDKGIGTRIVGTFTTVDDLPDATQAEEDQHAYIVEKNLYVAVAGQWVDMGDLSGPQGMGLVIKGSLPMKELLPTENNLPGDTYVINKAMWVFDGTAWVEFGQPGPTGLSAYEEAVKAGFVGSAVLWLESLKGDKGDQGDKGDKGDKGDAADALRLRGVKPTVDELPMEGTIGDAWVVGADIYAYTDAGTWENIGRYQGIDGTNGTDGVDGLGAYELAKQMGFTGTEQEYLDSLHGRNLQIDGVANSVAELPAAPADSTVKTYMVGDTLYVGTNGAWTSAGQIRGKDGVDGVDGKSALEEIAAAYPEVVDAATLAAFLKGEKGDKGDKGDTGDTGAAGPALNVRGVFATEAEVLALANPQNGDFAVGDRYHYIYDGVSWGKSLTLDGKDGVDGVNGTDGTNGIDGKDGIGIMVKGTLVSEANLPAGATVGDAYLINGDLWMYGTSGWFNGGPLQGDKGKDAYDLAVELGFVGSPQDWINHITGTDGMSAFDIAKEADPTLTDESAWLASLVGPKGDVGPMGPGVKIIGTLNSTADLPDASGYAPGDGFLINGHFWGKAGTTWVDCGLVQGPQGIQGIQGIQGVKGNPGVKGDRGASILLFDHDPGPLDGAVNDTAMNTVTQGLWLKTSSAAWTFMGNFGGGNVYSPNNDGKQYIRVGNTWQQFNHYDLLATATTGACDLTVGNVFTLDNSTTTAKTISFVSPPAGRATTVVLLIKGNAGALTWPGASVVTWSDSMVPELGVKLTNVVLLWDGSSFVGSVGAKA